MQDHIQPQPLKNNLEDSSLSQASEGVALPERGGCLTA
jgi:hypothetical protein